MITTFGGDTLVELVDDDKTISCHIQNKLHRDEDVNMALVVLPLSLDINDR